MYQVEVGSFAAVSVGGVVFGPGQQSSQMAGPMVAVVDGYSLVSGGGRQRRLTAPALWPKKHGPTARCRKPLSGRWMMAARWAALRPGAVVEAAIERLQAAELVKGGGAQSRSLVVGLQGKPTISPRPYNNANAGDRPSWS